MNRIIILLLFLASTGEIYCQQLSNVNFDEVKTEVADTNSIHYYPNLIDKIKSLDTNLTRSEYLHLYYGAVFQKNYHPYGATDAQVEFEEAYAADLKIEDLIEKGLKVFEENPINLGLLLKIAYLYSYSEQYDKATIFAKLYVSFLEVIYASGNGKTCESGFVVITVDDEYLITNDLGLKVIHQDLIGICDLLTFSKKGQKRRNRIKSLYFNVRMPLVSLSNSFDQPDLPQAEPSPDEKESE